MTTDRRRASRGRRLAALAALLLLATCLLPWYTFAGDLPARPYRAFDGSGVLVFVAALVTLALVALPFAAARGEASNLDRPIAFAFAAGVAVLGILLWPSGFLDEPEGLLPGRAPGFWIAVVAVIALVVAAFEIVRQRGRT